MSVITGCIAKATAAGPDIKLITRTTFDDFDRDKLDLDPTKFYMVALDQSTSCTGIAIIREDGQERILLEIKNNCGSKNDYYKELGFILKILFKDKKISILLNELPVSNPKKQFSGTVLKVFLGHLQEMISNIDSLDRAERFEMYPQTWKKYVVSKENAKTYNQKVSERSKLKYCIAYDLCEIFPEFTTYRDCHFNDDYDAFDALGILYGYLKYSRTPEGHIKIHGHKENRHKALVTFVYTPLEQIQQDPEVIKEYMGDNYGAFDPKFRVYNNEYSYYDNIRMASSNWDCTVTIAPDKVAESVHWKYGFDLAPNCVLLMYIIRMGHFDRDIIKTLQSDMIFNEVVE